MARYCTVAALAAALALPALGAHAPRWELAAAMLEDDAARARAAWDALDPENRAMLEPFGGTLISPILAAREGNVAVAVAGLRPLAGSPGPWRDVAAWQLADLGRSSGDAALEAEALKLLLPLLQGHPLKDSWGLRLGELHARAGRAAEARAVLGPMATSARERRTRRDAQAALLEMDLAGSAASYEGAAGRFEMMVDEGQDDDAALRAAVAVTTYEARHAIDPGPAGHRVRGLVFYRNRVWDAAIVHLARAASLPGARPAGFVAPAEKAERAGERGKSKKRRRRPPARPSEPKPQALSRAETVFFIGRTYYRKGDYQSAAAAFQSAAQLSASPGLSHSALYQRIVCLSRSRSYAQALVEIDGLAARDVGPSMQRQLLGRRITLLRSLGKGEDAARVLEGARSRGGGDAGQRRDLEWQAAALARDAGGDGALAALERLESSGGDDASRARLMRAQALVAAGKLDEARALLARVMADEPRGFRGEVARRDLAAVEPAMGKEWEEGIESARALLGASASGGDPAALARDRLLELRRRAPVAFRQRGLPVLVDAYRRLPAYAPALDGPVLDMGGVGPDSPRCLRLLSLGLGAAASFALLADPGDSGLAPLQRAGVHALGGEWGRALYLAEVHATRFPRDLVPEAVAPGLAALLYPLPRFLPEVARKEGVEPFLVAAITREESRFDPRARSAAGARGLMQLVMDTAEALAPAPPSVEDLYAPRTSVELGARYLSRLLAQFQGSEGCTIAAYNAGPDAAREWCDLGGGSLLAVEGEVGFEETRKYLGKVYLSMLRYREAHGDGATGPSWRLFVRLPEAS